MALSGKHTYIGEGIDLKRICAFLRNLKISNRQKQATIRVIMTIKVTSWKCL